MTITPQPVWQLEALLGEGPIWLPEAAALRFVDIKRGKVHTYLPDSDTRETLEVGGAPSFIVPASDGSLLVGSGNAIYRLEERELGRPIASIPEPATNRTNDACVDHTGRLWFGTMDGREVDRSGAIWCWNDGALTRAGPQAVVTNGPAASLGDRWLYHVDSGNRAIWRHPLSGASELPEGEVFIRIAESDGFPDGIVVDAEDCLWVALWDGWAVRRYSPDGELLLQVDFPCARVTKVAFGGPDLRTAYVTTARVGLSPAELEAQPLAGSLFAFEAPVRGQAPSRVRMFQI